MNILILHMHENPLLGDDQGKMERLYLCDIMSHDIDQFKYDI